MGLFSFKSIKAKAEELIATIKQIFVTGERPPFVTNLLQYWMLGCYFQQLDDDVSRAALQSSSLSLIDWDVKQEGFVALNGSLKAGKEYWFQVGRISLSEFLVEPFKEYGWKDQLEMVKGSTALFQLKFRYVEREVSPGCTVLSMEYVDQTFKLSPYLFALSPHYRKTIDRSSPELCVNLISTHKELCLKYDADYENAFGATKRHDLEEVLVNLTKTFQDVLADLGLEGLAKRKEEESAHFQYLVDLFEVNENEQVFLRDFYYEDLLHILKQFKQEQAQDGLLWQLIAGLEEGTAPKEPWYTMPHMLAWLHPGHYPLARWPSKYSPVLMQQLAINLAFRKPSEEYPQRVFSVNGPPGTGKTTLLKDVVAQKVCQRAQLIAELDGDCFDKPLEFRHVRRGIPPVQYTLTPLKRAFARFNMLVASSNNTAVENLTRELPDGANLPSLADLDGATSDPFDYFGAFATTLLSKLKDAPATAWGLIAVPLGKSSNMRVFREHCMLELMKELEARTQSSSDWEGDLVRAMAKFKRQRARVVSLFGQLDEGVLASYDPRTDEAQKTNPFHTEALNRERERLFYAALELLHAFNSQPCMLENFRFIMAYLECGLERGVFFANHYMSKDRSRREAQYTLSDLVPHGYNALFNLIPVLSTTFASVSRMFRDVMEPGSIGCLIVDEAGQAAPHMAAGALWRAQEAIVVGDPKQVEPVVKSDEVILRYCKQLLNLDKHELMRENITLQTVADLANPYGNYIGEADWRNWVGCPLRVHRRCCEPMFSISNSTSYNGTMILGIDAVLPPKKAAQMVLSSSVWWNVPGTVKRGSHFVESQGDAALSLVKAWMERWKGVEAEKRPKLYVISPFKSVVTQFRKQVRAFLRADRALGAAFPGWQVGAVGTVHTFQGKEAEEVIFLLGCDPMKQGAVQWVNSNILNVAVTRAKCRVYFIGDWEVWRQNKVFAKNIVFRPVGSEGEPLVKISSLEELKPAAPPMEEEPAVPERSDEELLDQLGVTPYLKWSVLIGLERVSGWVFVQDRERGWIFRIQFNRWGDFPLDASRIGWCEVPELQTFVRCALVYPLRVEADEATIQRALEEACLFYSDYVKALYGKR